MLRRDAGRHTRCDADADAALSDAFIRFVSYFQGADDDERHAVRWLRTATKHAARERAAAARREMPVPAITETMRRRYPGFGAEPRGELTIECLERFGQLSALKPDERIALVLLAAGFSYAEIADLRGWTYTKVNRCLAEGRAALRRIEGGEK